MLSLMLGMWGNNYFCRPARSAPDRFFSYIIIEINFASLLHLVCNVNSLRFYLADNDFIRLILFHIEN